MDPISRIRIFIRKPVPEKSLAPALARARARI
jgi:hypothetical protein